MVTSPTPKNDDWWPAPLAHLSDDDPWAERDVVVADIKSFNEKPHAGQRISFSALVPFDDLEAIKKNLAKFDHSVSASGPRPWPCKDSPYNPQFWIDGPRASSNRYEPLVLSWNSHDKTVLLPDPRFLMTYGLMPRNIGVGEVHWDDPRAPVSDVVKIRSVSEWDFPLATDGFISIDRDYLQDYLTLRRMALVQVYWEERFGETDEAMEERLGRQEAVDIKFADRSFTLRRSMEDKKIIATQVWGARVIAIPDTLPITENSLEGTSIYADFGGSVRD